MAGPIRDEGLLLRDPVLWRSTHQFDGGKYDSRNYGSVILIDGKEVAHLLRCCHCGRHFLNVKMPGRERGWCLNCNAPVCPNHNCDACVPFEQWLENVERGMPPGHRPITAAVRGEVPVSGQIGTSHLSKE
jgi:hypothetical protein